MYLISIIYEYLFVFPAAFVHIVRVYVKFLVSRYIISLLELTMSKKMSLVEQLQKKCYATLDLPENVPWECLESMIQKLIDKAGKGDSLTVQEVFETKCVFGFEAMKKMGAPGIPCVIDIARKYHGKVPLAVASSGNREHVHKSLEDAGIHELFDAIITCEDVTNPKPAPDIYLKAAAAIKCDPTKCRGFEDGDVGMESLVAAGMEAVDVRYMSDYPRDINGMRGSIPPGR